MAHHNSPTTYDPLPPEPDDLPVLTTAPALDVALTPVGPTPVRVAASDGIAGLTVDIVVSHPDLVTVDCSDPVTDAGGIVEVALSGPLTDANGAGPVTVTFNAEGHVPARVDVYGPARPERLVDPEIVGRELPPVLFPRFDPGSLIGPVDVAPDGGHGPYGADGDPYYGYYGPQPDGPPDEGPGEEPPGEPIAVAQCTPAFVNGIGNNRDCTPRLRPIDNRLRGRLHTVTYPGSRWQTAAGAAAQQAIIQDAIDFYADYCIDLVIRPTVIGARQARTMRRWYAGWYARLLNKVGGVKKLGKTTIPTAVADDFTTSMKTIQAGVGQRRLVVVFSDEYVTDTRALVSGTNEKFHQIGINFVDSKSPRILTHELVHALGKPAINRVGASTWQHESICKSAISTIGRTPQTLRKPVALAGNRYFDITEFDEIAMNRGARILR